MALPMRPFSKRIAICLGPTVTWLTGIDFIALNVVLLWELLVVTLAACCCCGCCSCCCWVWGCICGDCACVCDCGCCCGIVLGALIAASLIHSCKESSLVGNGVTTNLIE